MCIYWNPELCVCEAPCEEARLCHDMTVQEWLLFALEHGDVMCVI